MLINSESNFYQTLLPTTKTFKYIYSLNITMNKKEAEEIENISKNYNKYTIFLISTLIFLILAIIIYGMVVY